MILLERSGIRAVLPHLILGTLQTLRRMVWRITTPHTAGARAICLLGDAGVVLVRHSYMRGWFLPGGGPRQKEDLTRSLLRELREEIGMEAPSRIEQLFVVWQRANFKHDRQAIYLVQSDTMNPRLSLEIEAIGVFQPDNLPDDTHPSTRYKIERWRLQSRGTDVAWDEIDIPPEN